MSDLIDRQAVIDLLKQMRKDGDMVPWEGKDVFARIRKLPTIQPEKAQLSKEGATKGTTSDLISRTETVERLRITLGATVPIADYDDGYVDGVQFAISTVSTMPTVQPEPTDINAKEAVYNLAEKIGIHQLFALTVELRGEPIQPELTDEQVEEYCKKRCLHVVTDDFFESTKPQRLGHWIKHIDPFDGEQYECSECGVLWEFNDGTPEDNEAYFCPKCGAKMKGEANE